MTVANTLMIDDSEEFSESMRRLFQEESIPLDFASNWDKGVSLFKVGLHELVIADYNLPGSEHGLKLLAAVKPLRPSSKLILISGALTSRAEEIVAATKLVDDYLAKTPSLGEALIEEAREADARAREPSDWLRTAQAHREGETIFDEDIKKIDTLLRGELKPP